jgi:hypothetical protein
MVGRYYTTYIGAGWVTTLLQTERGPWTDETGSIKYNPIHEFKIPSVAEITDWPPSATPYGRLEWIEDSWQLDNEWSEVDEEGWQYYDNLWQSPKRNRAMGSFTRRRKHIRHLTFIEEVVNEEK